MRVDFPFRGQRGAGVQKVTFRSKLKCKMQKLKMDLTSAGSCKLQDSLFDSASSKLRTNLSSLLHFDFYIIFYILTSSFHSSGLLQNHPQPGYPRGPMLKCFCYGFCT